MAAGRFVSLGISEYARAWRLGAASCRQPDHALYMAGLYWVYEGKSCYVILTTAANPSVADIHDRMSLVLQPNQIDPWMEDHGAALSILYGTPPMLQRRYA